MPTTVTPTTDQYGRHRYTDDLPACPLVPDAGEPFSAIGVTSQLKPLKADFSDHAAATVATWAVQKHDVWKDLTEPAAIELIKGERRRALDKAANRGIDLHRAVEAFAVGQQTLTILDPEAAPYLPSVQRFVDECRPRFIWSEVAVFSREHNYAGKSDGVVTLEAYPELGVRQADWKSREKAHVYETEAPQLAAYAKAEYGILDGARVPLPAVDGGIVVCFTPDGYELFPVDLEQAWPVFLAAKHLYQIKGDARRAVGKPIARTETAACSSVTVDEVRALVQNIVDAGHGDTLAALWPADLPTLKQGGHDALQLSVIDALCAQVERRCSMPFREGSRESVPSVLADASTSVAPITTDDVGAPTSDLADPERIEAAITRCKALPSDLFSAVESSTVAAGCPNLRSGRATVDDVALVEAQLDLAEAEHERRKLLFSSIVHGCDDDLLAAVLRTATGDKDARLLTEADMERVEELVAAVDACVLALDFSNDVAALVAASNAEDILTARCGGKAGVLHTGRQLATRHGLDAPRSAAAVAAEPTLAALVLSTHQHNESTKGTAA